VSPHPLFRNTIVVANTADTATLAHELGHILINTDHIAGPALMDATATGAGTQIPAISDANCTTAYNNA
jgi:Zn-dependent peptidase ImmA (M78 family)